MELSALEHYIKKLFQFLDLEQIVSEETWKIFDLILAEVESQGKEVLLFPPVKSKLWVEWLVKPPEGTPAQYYRHLFLKFYPTASRTIDLVLVERYEGRPDNLDQAVFQEDYRAGNIERYDKTFLASMARWTDEGGRKVGSYLDYGMEELARFPLVEGINAEKVGQRIITEAQEIQWQQSVMAKACRKEHSKSKAKARQRRALVHDTPKPSAN